MRARRSFLVLGSILAGLLAACSSPPPASLAQARGEVNSALSAADPATYSRPELDQARAKLDQAENAARDDDMTASDRLSQEALADLRLSRSAADAANARTAEQQLSETMQSLAHETGSPMGAAPPPPPPGMGAAPPPPSSPSSR